MGNYGWSARESNYGFGNKDLHSASKRVDPIWEYDHRVGKSITGGFVYRGKRLPELEGLYLYADYIAGKIWALDYDEKTGKTKRNLRVLTGGLPVLAFGEDEAGEVYYMIETVNGKSVFRFERK